jgi:FixJ family two-component response regulator
MSADAKESDKPLISVADDDSLIRDSMVRLICSFGFRVEAFTSAEEFANSGYLEETACLILDVRMPGMSGIEFRRQLVANHSEVPVIFITAHEEERVRAQALLGAAGNVLIKPFSEQALMNAIHAALTAQ